MANSGATRAVSGAASLVAAVTIGLTGCVAGDVPAAPVDDPVLVLGQNLYTGNCASCHGLDGGGGAGSKLNGGRVVDQFPDIADQFEVVAEGRRAMPGFDSKLSDEELTAVVAYTREVLDTVG